jgi:osmotically-inducible protein OsmY
MGTKGIETNELRMEHHMTQIIIKSDLQLKTDVLNELKWDPSVSDTHIGVTVHQGIVTLRGYVPHYYEKSSAEKAAQRVSGVRAIADELDVKFANAHQKKDEDLAKAALMALEWSYSVPAGVTLTVDNGWITLTGTTDWDFQRNAAKFAVFGLKGVRGVTNEIQISTKVQTSDIKTRIEEALKRSAEKDGRNIDVTVEGDLVTLSGKVQSLSEIEVARYAAWSAPGVMSVNNNLKLSA